MKDSKKGDRSQKSGALSRVTYPDLFAEIGTTFTAGGGSTTFHVPDMSEQFLRGAQKDDRR